MKYLFTFFIYVFITCGLLNAQESERIDINQQLEAFEIKDKQSLKDYYNLSYSALQNSFGQLDKRILKRGQINAQKIEADTLLALFSQLLTYTYTLTGNDIDSILFYADIQIKASQKINSFNLLGSSYEYMGIGYLHHGNYSLALDYFTKCYEIRKEEGTFHYASNVLGSIASVYTNLGDIKNALKYTKLALEYLKKSSFYSEKTPGFLYYQLADLYDRDNQRDSSEFYRLKNLNTIRLIGEPNEANHKHFFLWSYIFSGQHFIEMGQLDSVKHYLTLAKPLREFEPFTYDELQFKYCLKTGNCSNMVEQLRTIKDYESSLVLRQLQKFCALKRDYFKSIGDYSSALEVADSIQILQEKRLTNERNNYAVFMDAQFENSAKKQEIEQLKTNNQLKESRLQLFALGFILSLLVLGFSFYAYFQMRKNFRNSQLIEEQTKILQQNELQKNRLLNNIAHEFQTPLSIILGLSKQKINDLDNAKEFFHIISRNTKYLSDSVNQMLRIDKANVAFDSPKADLCRLTDFFQFLMPEYFFLASQKNINLIGPKVAAYSNLIYSDVEKIAVILKNLLANAIKYTPRGGQVQLIYNIDAGFHYFKIQDNGIGISEAEQAHIFDRNFQSEVPEEKEGFGLGLAICKEYVDLLGGKVELESEIGKGTTFILKIPKLSEAELSKLSLTLPLYEFPVIEKPIQTTLNKNVISSVKDYHLLIVEDNLDFCKYLEIILGKDYNLTFLHSGDEAIEYLSKHEPSLIVTDWMMEGMNGLSFVKEYRKMGNKPIPIIMLTARTIISDQLKALSYGVNEYLVKPVDETIFLSKIRQLLELKGEAQGMNSFFAFQEAKINNQHFTKNDQDWLLEVENVIQSNLQNFEFKLGDLATALGISRSHLSNKIKTITGLTGNGFIQEIRYWEARRLLEEKRINSVKALSLTVGFKDIKNFSRNFKKRFDKYPNDYLVGEID